MCFLVNKYGEYFAFFIILSTCEAISNTSFIPNLLNYSVNDTSNSSNVKTLQKEESGRKVNILPPSNPIKFEENHDSELSSSSHSRGILIHDHPGYGLHDYDDIAHYEYGHDYQVYDPHYNPHGSHGHGHYGNEHYYVGHHGYGKGHYKYANHALATKAVLWPLAGIALLGAAAALVTNPVLLQLGVVSGKRRRRDTEEITGPDILLEAYKDYTENNKTIYHKSDHLNNNKVKKILKLKNVKRDTFSKEEPNRNGVSKKKLEQATTLKGLMSRTSVDLTTYPPNPDNKYNQLTYIPIPILLKSPKLSRN